MLAPLDNETIFKRAFTNKIVLQQFVKDLFEVDVNISKIETEKKFTPPIANIDFKLDIYAETEDHRFVIEIQRIDFDYNFNRFLNYFMSLILEQQKKGSKYEIPQTVLGIVVLTQPYKLNQLTGEPIKDSVLTIDFDPRNLLDERIKLWKHQLLFLNPHPKYRDVNTPKKFQDWLDLFRLSIDSKINLSLNLNNKGISKTLELIEYDKLDPHLIEEMKISESKKAMIKIVEEEGVEKGIQKEKYETAKKSIIAGLSNEIIISITDLTNEQINEIRKELQK